MQNKYQDMRITPGRWIMDGMKMGIVAGMVFLLFEMVVAGVLQDSPFRPMRMIGAVILTEDGLEAVYPLTNVIPMALIVHFFLSAAYGAIFGGLVLAVPTIGTTRLRMSGAATIMGLLLWLINFYLIAPGVFPWFANANPIVQFFAHTIFYGTTLGLLLSYNDLFILRRDPQHERQQTPTHLHNRHAHEQR